jgi:hypothetical protein
MERGVAGGRHPFLLLTNATIAGAMGVVMTRADQIEIALRIVIDRPVPGVLHSLQAKNGEPLDPKSSERGLPLTFDFSVRVAPGPRFLGDQIQREGPERRFVYIRIGQAAGDPASPWTRRMKIDIHDIDARLLERAAAGEIVETTVVGTARDGTPSCATLVPIRRRLVSG